MVFLCFCRVNPLYYVAFTTSTLVASFILYRGFNTTDAVNTLSLLCGFLVTFSGVYLLNLSRGDPDGRRLLNGKEPSGVPTDGISSLQTRRSMQAQRSFENGRLSSGSISYSRGAGAGDREGLIHAYDEENGGFGLADLTEDSEGDSGGKPQQNVGRRASRTATHHHHPKRPNR